MTDRSGTPDAGSTDAIARIERALLNDGQATKIINKAAERAASDYKAAMQRAEKSYESGCRDVRIAVENLADRALADLPKAERRNAVDSFARAYVRARIEPTATTTDGS